MGQQNPQPMQFLRELVMITSFTLALVVVSYGLHSDHAFKINQMENGLESLLPSINEPALLHPAAMTPATSAKVNGILH